MKKLRQGQIFTVSAHTFPNDKTALVNYVLNTHYTDVKNRAGFYLKETPSVLAWFVYMDNNTHGPSDAYLWKNEILPNGYIREKYVSDIKYLPTFLQIKLEKSFSPYRLAFCLSPDGISGEKSCKFMGAYMLDGFETADATITRYKLVADTFLLGKEYDSDELESIFLKDAKHHTPIETLHLKTNQYTIKYVSQLLNVPLIAFHEHYKLLNSLVDHYRY